MTRANELRTIEHKKIKLYNTERKFTHAARIKYENMN